MKKWDYDSAELEMRRAVAIQDGFRYMEPEHWILPLRQCLGAVILKKYDSIRGGTDETRELLLREAFDVVSELLRLHPQTGWSFKGLLNTMDRIRATESKVLLERIAAINYEETELYFKASWRHSDIEIHGSCCEFNLC